jgi:DNA-binding response OmpR family regulator
MAPTNTLAARDLSPSGSEYEPGPRVIADGALASQPQVRILAISFAVDDHNSLGQIVHEMPFLLTTTQTCEEAAMYLKQEKYDIILCDRTLPDGNWIDILNQISGAAGRPLLIVTSRLADDALWAEVLNLGGYDVLAKPFRRQEVQFVLTSAWVQKSNPVRQACTAQAA